MIDTIAAMTTVALPDHLFTGGRVSEDFESGEVHVRLWRNPRGEEYEPRFTYWRERQILKVEVSLPKLINSSNLMSEAISEALDVLDFWISEAFGKLTSVREWTCQRVDYVYEFDVTNVSWYLATYGAAKMTGMSRHDYRRDGVVWKQGNRWVKLYDKRKEQGDEARGLRLEISNYASAVRYMAEAWFGCERTVSEMVHVGRALYVLSVYFEKLSLHRQPRREVRVLREMRQRYEQSAAAAWYTWTLLRVFGSEAAELGLISRSQLSRWRKRLRDDGFMVMSDDQERESVLSLPVSEVISDVRENLGLSSAPLEIDPHKNFAEILGLTGVEPGDWLMLEFLKLEGAVTW